MLNSKEILEQTGISRATLNNYIGWGIVPRPEVLPPGPQDGEAPRIGYFPDGIVGRIAEIQRLKKDGWSMARIAEHFGGKPPPAGAIEDESLPAPTPAPAAEFRPDPPSRSAPLHPPASPFVPSGHGRKRAAGPTEVAVLVAGLQHSTRIWSELPPDEYFELINQIWSTVDPIFRRHAGTDGKHPADGMVCYFFPLPSGSYLWNALLAAQEIRQAMRGVSKQWQLKKGWSTELYMNIGIDEGREWLGTFKPAGEVEFTALADTIKQAARISDFSRFGAIWATRNLLGKLSDDERRRLKYGVRRKSSDGQHVFLPCVFSSVQRPAAGAGERIEEVAIPPIAEIVEIQAGSGRQAFP